MPTILLEREALDDQKSVSAFCCMLSKANQLQWAKWLEP